MPFPQLDAAVARVKAGAKEFAGLPVDERISLLRGVREGFQEVAEESVRLACAWKGHDFESPRAGEEWFSGPVITNRILRLTEETLHDVKAYGAPRIDPGQLRQLPDGRLAVRLFPHFAFDSVLLGKHTCEAYMQPGVTAANLREHQASFYRKPHGGRLCLVLGAGNVNAIPPTDVATKLFIDGAACVLKMNPVNAYLGPLLERAFKGLIARGFFAVVYGGAEEGAFLVNHPAVDEIHITGSDKTYDAMVWGPPGEREGRKARDEPVLKKGITSELGNITPVIVVPGAWDDAALDAQARNIAGMVCNNASYNCAAGKLLVTSKAWPQRDAFLARLQHWLDVGGVRKAWYPGAEDRWKAFTEGRKNVKLVGQAGPGQLSYALLTDVDRGDANDRVWRQEPWCTLVSETCFDTTDVAKYCADVTAFVNERVWGTLTSSVHVHKSTASDPVAGAAVERMIEQLRYGSVAVNSWGGAVMGIGNAPWGGHPSTTPKDIQSGSGWVHNVFMLEDVEKVVLRAPAKVLPVSPWVAGHRTGHTLGRRVADFEYRPSALKIPLLAAAALRG